MVKTRKKVLSKVNRESIAKKVVDRIRRDNITEIKPVYDPEKNCTNCYPIVEKFVDSNIKIEPLLEEIAETGVLVKELYDKMVLCPKCNSRHTTTRYICPYCNSFDIEKSSLIEHIKCGYMDVEQKFRKDKKLVCPKCGNKLNKVDFDYKKAGVWCKCNNCEKNFDIPTPSHFCRKCGSISTFEEINLKNVFSYTVKEAAKKVSTHTSLFSSGIKKFLADNDWKVKSQPKINGKSGAEYEFDIIAFKKLKSKEIIVIDIAISEESVAEQPVVALFAKIFDVSPKKSILITIPKINDNGKKMADLYKIQVIEAKDQTQIIEKLKKIVES